MRLFDRSYSQAKSHVDGTHRTRSPAATLEAFWPVASRLGITRLANVTGLDHVGVPVYQCIRPNGRSLSVSQGKGLTREAAKTSAFMESVETWHAETMAIPATFDALPRLARSGCVADLDRLPRLTRRRLVTDAPMPWVQGFDLAQQRATWVPYDSVGVDHHWRRGVGRVFLQSSAGLASGNHLLEATLHALCELIEHDAHRLWALDPADPMGTKGLVALDTIDDAACVSVIDKFREAGLTVAVHDITSDVGVPCYQCLILDSPHSFQPVRYAWGQGCHPSRDIALLRALTEAAQCRLTYIAGARDDLGYHDYALTSSEGTAAGILETLQSSPPAADFRARPSIATDTFEGDLQAIVDRLGRVGCVSVLVVDLTHPELGVPVVKVLVPGLVSASEESVLGERAARLQAPEVAS